MAGRAIRQATARLTKARYTDWKARAKGGGRAPRSLRVGTDGAHGLRREATERLLRARVAQRLEPRVRAAVERGREAPTVPPSAH